MLDTIKLYGPIPALDGVSAEALAARLFHDKKTIKGRVHWVLPEKVGQVAVVSGIDDNVVRAAIRQALG
jgi:3-dehydroquinate synthase